MTHYPMNVRNQPMGFGKGGDLQLGVFVFVFLARGATIKSFDIG